MLPVESDGFHELCGGKMAGEGVREAHLSGDQGAVRAGTKDPERYIQSFAGYSPYPGTVTIGGKEMLHFLDVAEKVVWLVEVRAADLQGCCLVRAGCASKAEVDPSRIEGGQRAELFGDDEGCVIWEHDT